MKNKLLNLFALTAVASLLPSFAAFAQAPPPPGAPIDGGASLLIAAGVALGVKKLVDRKRGR
jgi:hypothetical protein